MQLEAPDTNRLRKDYPQLHLADTEEDEFDPNELKLLPVLATDRNTTQGRNNELRRQQKQLMKSSKRLDDAKFVSTKKNGKAKM